MYIYLINWWIIYTHMYKMQILKLIIFYVSRVLMFYSSRFLEPSWWRFKSDWLKTQVLEWPARSHSSSFFQKQASSIWENSINQQKTNSRVINLESGSPEIKEKGPIIMKFINLHCNWGSFLDSVAERIRKSTKLYFLTTMRVTPYDSPFWCVRVIVLSWKHVFVRVVCSCICVCVYSCILVLLCSRSRKILLSYGCVVVCPCVYLCIRVFLFSCIRICDNHVFVYLNICDSQIHKCTI